MTAEARRRPSAQMDTEQTATGPPWELICAAGAAWLVAAALMFAPEFSLSAHIPGYTLSAPAVFLLVAKFRRVDTRRRRSRLYLPARWWSHAGTVLLVLALAPTVRHAWSIATVLAS